VGAGTYRSPAATSRYRTDEGRTEMRPNAPTIRPPSASSPKCCRVAPASTRLKSPIATEPSDIHFSKGSPDAKPSPSRSTISRFGTETRNPE